jgi:hypothetical protein
MTENVFYQQNNKSRQCKEKLDFNGSLCQRLKKLKINKWKIYNLKGQCHEIFDLWFFSSNNPIWAPD